MVRSPITPCGHLSRELLASLFPDLAEPAARRADYRIPERFGGAAEVTAGQAARAIRSGKSPRRRHPLCRVPTLLQGRTVDRDRNAIRLETLRIRVRKPVRA